jgi:(2Fe-2S) ferredoxin
MLGYDKHVFFCQNQREQGVCCAHPKTLHLRDYAKNCCKKLGIHAIGKIRINKAGCLGLCKYGPILVVYPDAVWYRYANETDIDEIIQQHLQKNQIVQRLMLNKELSGD